MEAVSGDHLLFELPACSEGCLREAESSFMGSLVTSQPALNTHLLGPLSKRLQPCALKQGWSPALLTMATGGASLWLNPGHYFVEVHSMWFLPLVVFCLTLLVHLEKGKLF